MITLLLPLAAGLVLQSPGADSLRAAALRLPETALIAEARAQPLVLREAVSDALVRALKLPARSGEEFEIARRLTAAYAIAWRDSFLVRQVARFIAWPPGRRAAKVRADSIRRAGVAAYGRDGPIAAIVIWRRALAAHRAIADSAGMAAVLGNIGAGFVATGRLDSAESYLRRAQTLAGLIGDVRVQANAVGSLAGVSEDLGRLAEARVRYREASALRERIGDSRGIAADHNNLGLLARTEGDLTEARTEFEAALAINRRDGRDEVAATNRVNLAGLATLSGQFTQAAGMYRDALAVWRAQERWAETASALHGLGQIELRQGDYATARETLREARDIYQRSGELPEALAVWRDLAGAIAALGDLQGSLDELREAQRIADSARLSPGLRAGLILSRADLAQQLNARAEAERLYVQAALLYRRGGDPAGEAEALEGRGMLRLARDDLTGAGALLDSALRVQRGAGHQRSAALTRLQLGILERKRGDTAAARRQLLRARSELDRLGDSVSVAAAMNELAGLELANGHVAPAESTYREGLARLRNLPAPEVGWRLHAGLAQARRARGDLASAVAELRAALTTIETPRRSLALPERRSAFLADKWEVYAQLAMIERERGRTGAAFEASESLRAREMLELLGRGRVSPADTADDVVAREQDLRRRIAELNDELEASVAGREDVRGPELSRAGASTRQALIAAQQAYADLLLEIRERAPRYSALLSTGTVHWQDVASRLGPDEAFIEYLLSDSASLAFVVTRDSVVALDLRVRRRELAQLVDAARGTLEQRGAVRADSLWRGPLRRLYRVLIAPAEATGLLAGKTRLVLAPHAELHYLPFAALLEDGERGRFLVERYELVATPSAAVWLSRRERPTSSAQGALALAPQIETLPTSRREVAAVARLTGAEVLRADAATEAAFRLAAPSRRLLHLASNGVLNKQNPLFSYIDLAPGSGYDGRLEVHEVFGLHLAADLVVLSACQTGLGSGTLADVPAGDDWVGLTRAFLHAGAARVIGTLWPVDDWATAALMERFYQALGQGTDAVRALAEAQRAMLGTGAAGHPFSWAGFVIAERGVSVAAPTRGSDQ